MDSESQALDIDMRIFLKDKKNGIFLNITFMCLSRFREGKPCKSQKIDFLTN